jgi:hypothetical protein
MSVCVWDSRVWKVVEFYLASATKRYLTSLRTTSALKLVGFSRTHTCVG